MGGSDANCFGDVNDRKSMKGYHFKLNGRGTAFRWAGNKRPTVGNSSSEAEYQGSSSRSTVHEANSVGFFHATQSSDRSWRVQLELYQILAKLSHSQEEYAHSE